VSAKREMERDSGSIARARYACISLHGQGVEGESFTAPGRRKDLKGRTKLSISLFKTLCYKLLFGDLPPLKLQGFVFDNDTFQRYRHIRPLLMIRSFELLLRVYVGLCMYVTRCMSLDLILPQMI
jgi:hypothetical protein